MFCKKCGNQIENGAVFCKKCGTPIEQVKKIEEGNVQENVSYIKSGIIAASLFLILSSIVPFYKIDSRMADLIGADSISWIKIGNQVGDGIIMIILAGLIILFICLNKRLPVLLLSISSVLIYCYHMFLLKQGFQDIEEGVGAFMDVNDLISKGIGYHLMLFSIILLFVLSVVCFLQKKMSKSI